MGSSIDQRATYLQLQKAANQKLQDLYAKDLHFELDKINEPILWVKNMPNLFAVICYLQTDEIFKINYLSDLTAYDNIDHIDGDKRFVLVYQLLSLETKVSVRLKLLIDDSEDAKTISHIFPAANWLEREVFDMYGIVFRGHPDLRRIMMDERFIGHPQRKEYDIKQRMPFADNMKTNLDRNPVP
ncbi:MAG: NADH-quinone oxidoreductase subunit C [Oligoflexia bacterium]|nr:NADH-quinone oxidoreductase subunit C [Oligoflexia bacterium]